MNAETAYLFRHALLRDAAYELQLPAERARLHLLALHILEQVVAGNDTSLRAMAAELADHAAAAGGDPELVDKQRRYLNMAAEHERRSFRYESELRHLRRLDALQGHSQQEIIPLWLQISIACYQTGDPHGAEEWCLRAESLARRHGDLAHAGEALSLRAAVRHQLGDSATAGTLYQEASSLLEPGSPAAIRNAINRAAYFKARGMLAKAIDLVVAARQECRTMTAGKLPAVSTRFLADMLSDAGRLSEALPLYQSLLESSDPMSPRDRAVLLGNYGMCVSRSGDHRRGAAMIREAIAGLRAIGARFDLAFAQGQLAGVVGSSGATGTEVEHLRRGAADTFRELGYLPDAGFELCGLAEELWHRGRFSEAQLAFQEGVALLESRADGMLADMLCEVGAPLALLDGRPQHALDLAARAESLLMTMEEHDRAKAQPAIVRARVALAARDLPTARSELAIATAHSPPTPGLQQLALAVSTCESARAGDPWPLACGFPRDTLGPDVMRALAARGLA